jgi:nuclear RNA export factor
MKIKAFLDDEDMGNDIAQNTSGDLKKKGRFRNRKGSPLPNRRIGGMNLIQNHAGWYLITIHHGSKYEKDVLLKLLTNALLPTVFNAHYYKIDTENSCAQFYVDDYDVAAKILAQDKKINLPDGFKMIIRVRGSVPHVKVDEALKERMKLAMVKRYNQQTKALDLTKFHSDQDLSDVFCALFRPQIMSAVIDIIVENIPDLEALNLNENKLNMFDHLKILSSKLLQLKIIYLANNRVKIRYMLYASLHLLISYIYIFLIRLDR